MKPFPVLAVPLTFLTLAASADTSTSYDAVLQDLRTRAAIEDPVEREQAVDALWSDLVEAGRIPLREGERVAFLYRAEDDGIREVAWRGDMTGWEVVPSHVGARLGRSRVWLVEDVLPGSARIDYKLFVDGGWRLDPANPEVQVGGYGPNSELRMPEYAPPPEVERRDGVPRGTLLEAERIASTALGYDVRYRVYLPAGPRGPDTRLPVVYVTDGQDYADGDMGRMTVVLDNRIDDGTLPPLIAVFVDPRDPRNDDNRRLSEYGERPDAFATFLAEELVPRIDARHPTRREARARVVVGTSLGGLAAARVVLDRSETIARALVQSPAFGYDASRHGGRLVSAWRDADPAPTVRMFVNVGTIHDGAERTRAFRDLLVERGVEVRHVEVPEGHSWGHWRAWIDDGLAYLLAPAEASPAGSSSLSRGSI